MADIKFLPTPKDFESFLSLKSEGTIGLKVVHFKSEWSEPCKQMTEILLEIKDDKEYSGVEYAEVNAEDIPEVSMKYNITAVPTVLLFAGGNEIERIDGLRKAKLTTFIKSYILNPNKAVAIEPPVTVKKQVAVAAVEPLDERLRKLVNSHAIMVFMKGTPETPRCGFSKTLMGILKETGLPFQTFDILEDEEVRQGLKTFSNWQTYPQIYAKGELVGGLDIVKELVESNELLSTLKGEQ